jgi:hypothetical protein
VDLVTGLTTHLPSGGVLALVAILIFVLLVSLNDGMARRASMVLLALRGKAPRRWVRATIRPTLSRIRSRCHDVPGGSADVDDRPVTHRATRRPLPPR